jgi:hypothetical protein
MHSRQASVLAQAQRVVARLEGRISKEAASPILWKYEDNTVEGSPKVFYLEEKKMPCKSPFTGKTISARPVKHNLAQVSKEMKEDRNEGSLDPSKLASFVNPFEE